MNSLSRRNRWPWTDQSGGASHPKRHRARLGTMGQHLARLTALALGVWLILASPSDAFRDSQLDPLNIVDWAPLKTYFEISQVDFGIGETVAPYSGLVVSSPRITFIAEAKRSFFSTVVPTSVRFYDADNVRVTSTTLRCQPMLLGRIQVGERRRCSFFFNPSTHPTVEKLRFEFARGGPVTSRSSGPNESGGGLGDGDDCSRCEVYRIRESNCGRDCSVRNPYNRGGTSFDAVDRCHDRAAECRAAAARAFEQCESQCRR
jgi:hypothetical protein